jgi:hypothetical protein
LLMRWRSEASRKKMQGDNRHSKDT